jgi:DNA-binding transcriptional LysR family regulator
MPEKRSQEIDTRMMRVIYHLLTECSVSRAAALLNMSQPAASQNLSHWREVTSDQLMVRSGSHMVLTEHGGHVLRKVTTILAELDGIIHPLDHFDASLSRRKVSLFTANALAPFFVPRLVQIVRKEATNMQLYLRPIMSEAQLLHELETGEIDLAIGNWPTPPVNMRYSRLFQSSIVCVVRAGHPLARQTNITLKEYLTLDHLSPTPASSMTISPISARLAEIGVRRRIAVSIPEFSLAPQIIAASDLVFTTARTFAEQMRPQGDFALLAAPKELGAMTFYMLWHDRLNHSAYGKWLRSLVKRVSEEMNPD